MSATPAALPVPIDRAAAEQAYDRAVTRWAQERRAMVAPFVRRNFGLRGTLGLHRHALGWDVVRAPANVGLAVPALGVSLAAAGLKRTRWRRAGERLGARSLFFETAVAREIEWRLWSELLELPYERDGRRTERDALAEALLSDPAVAAALEDVTRAVRARAGDPDFRRRLEGALADYTGSRVAAAEIATNIVGVATGAAAWHQFTPGAWSLGPVAAGALAHHMAVSQFPLGAWAGGLWYGLFPAQPGLWFVAGVTGGVLAAAAVLSAFAGIVADPVQNALGLHRRRLHKLIDTLEARMRGDDARLKLRDAYVARLLDLFDVLRMAVRPV